MTGAATGAAGCRVRRCGGRDDGWVDIDASVRCPRCGAFLWLPLELVSTGNAMTEVRIRQPEFEAAVARHVELNPGLHAGPEARP